MFCSASDGLDPRIEADVPHFISALKSRSGEFLYGGGRVGLMGIFADHALRAGVVARGCITKGLQNSEVGHTGLNELAVVDDLFERKRWFIRESDAFVIYPGGFGTLDEALEVITWKVLGELGDKPIVFVNLNGFWNSTLSVFEELVEQRVIRRENLSLYEVVRNGVEAIDRIGAELTRAHRAKASPTTPGQKESS
ncbi:MAG TPA: TIGR00730 family Rossman fold protein [Pseudobdellovibrionaceae bacterium]|nr:TIGR00730 family Rossman fold protein [Pseudobdellovibrionaceae bacterium]